MERCIRTIKDLCGCLLLIPLTHVAFRREFNHIVRWYNESRPHDTLQGQTPNEWYFGRFPTCRKLRHEPRSRWPRGSPCAGPWALVRGKPGAKLELQVALQGRHKHLPIVSLRRAA